MDRLCLEARELVNLFYFSSAGKLYTHLSHHGRLVGSLGASAPCLAESLTILSAHGSLAPCGKIHGTLELGMSSLKSSC